MEASPTSYLSGFSKGCCSPVSTGGHQLPGKALGPQLPSTHWAVLLCYRLRDLLKETVHQAHSGARGWGPKEVRAKSWFLCDHRSHNYSGQSSEKQHFCPWPREYVFNLATEVLQMLGDHTQKRDSRNDPPSQSQQTSLPLLHHHLSLGFLDLPHPF